MKKRLISLLLILALLASLTACVQSGGAYSIIETLREGQYAIGFRQEDPMAEYVEAAIKVLCAQGKLRELDFQWFGKDVSSFPADENALGALLPPEPRRLIMGLSPDNFPMSYASGGTYMGYDVDVATAVCHLLGWELVLQPIADESQAYVELHSGNVDCVWGGMMLDAGESRFQVICPYMDAKIVVLVLAGSGLNSMRKLSGKVIGMSTAKKYADAVDQTDLVERAEAIEKVDGGNEQVFNQLYAGVYDAIITDSVAAAYYMRS